MHCVLLLFYYYILVFMQQRRIFKTHNTTIHAAAAATEIFYLMTTMRRRIHFVAKYVVHCHALYRSMYKLEYLMTYVKFMDLKKNVHQLEKLYLFINIINKSSIHFCYLFNHENSFVS